MKLALVVILLIIIIGLAVYFHNAGLCNGILAYLFIGLGILIGNLFNKEF
jgi:hypothetical protein